MKMLGKIQKGCTCRMCIRGRGWPATRLAKRGEQRAFGAEVDDLLSIEIFEPFRDLSDCRHGCNGDCENWGGEGSCDFTCHDRRCENCTLPTESWYSTGWFCNYECAAEYDRALSKGLS